MVRLSMRVIIVGGGVMGTSVALSLAQRGAEVLVLERSVPGAEASSAAAGILAPALEGAHVPFPEQVVPFGVASKALHEQQATMLRDAHGLDVGFRACGLLQVALQGEDDAHLGRTLALIESIQPKSETWVENLNATDARALEANLSPKVTRALRFPKACQLDPKKLLRALAIASERAGVAYRCGAVVHGVEASESAPPKVLLSNEVLEADHVVIAAGSWTSLLPGLDVSAAKVHPVRGQIVTTNTRPPLFSHMVFGAGGYLVTRPDGQVLCGSTEERVGFQRGVTFGGMQVLLKMATQVAPRLKHASIDAHWSSFRPGTADELPLIGPSAQPGFSIASGHYRNGILQAPITADIITRQLLGDAPSPFESLVDPRRFS